MNAVAKRLPFYGWVIVFLAAVNSAFQTGGAHFASSVFAGPMHDDLGWTKATVFGALTLRVLAGGVLGPFLGPLVDHRWVPRVMLPLGAVVSGLSFILVTWVETPFHYYMAFGVLGSLGAVLSVGVLDAIVIKWFVRRRAQALMWANIGSPLGILIFPPIIILLIATVGWRMAWFWTGLGVIAVIAPLMLLVRTSPESVGLMPDNGASPAGEREAAREVAPEEPSLTRREALSTSSFWMLSTVGLVAMLGLSGFQVQWLPFMEDRGVGGETGAAVLMVYGVCAVANRFIWGTASSRFPLRYVFTCQAGLTGLSVVLVILVGEPWMLFVWGATQGLTQPGFFQLHALTVANHFGRDHIGGIRGMMRPFMTTSSAASPLLLATLRDNQGSYTGAFSLVAGCWLLVSALVFFTKPPRHKVTSTVEQP
ncbi:MAG: MFS transporter [Chloroflexota bacterium]|nr:MFS transporter [Chloroflexota bacterium]